MYFFVPYQLTGIQQGIQCGHASLEYMRKYWEEEDCIDFRQNWKTWVILNGGTTSDKRDSNGARIGTLNDIADQLLIHDIQFAVFNEPDLQDALTSVCFICDERVFNKELYPDFKDFLLNKYVDGLSRESRMKYFSIKNDYSLLKKEYPIYYREWLELIGGEKNSVLKEIINGKKLA